MRTNYLFIFMGTILFFSCAKPVSPHPYVLHKNRTTLCQETLEKSIATLINAKHLQLSQDAFSKKPFLYLTNQKSNILGHSSIINDLNGRKKLLLYKKANSLYVATSDKKGNILKSHVVKNCLTGHPN